MKKILLPLLILAATNVIAETATFAGEVNSAAGANWYFEGYKQDNGAKIDCKVKASFSNTPQDGYKNLKQSKVVKEGASKIEKVCSFNNGEETGKLCIIKAEYVPSKITKGEFDITKVISVQEKPGKLACQ